MTRTPRRTATLRGLVGICALALTAAGTGAFAAAGGPTEPPRTSAAKVPYALVDDRDVDDRLRQPEDRYAVAGGCYTVEARGHGFVSRADDALVLSDDESAAVPLHFQPTRLGEYLLATNEGRDTAHEDAWWDLRNYVAGSSTLPAPAPRLPPGSDVVLAEEPSPDAEWRLAAAGADGDAKASGQDYVLSMPSRDQVLVVADGTLRLVDDALAPTALTLRHVPDDNPSDDDGNGTRCASWPEIETGASGEPKPVKGNPAAPVRGFFEAHVHGMAFEFLGGELRCGRPWHPYGVEYALGSCYEENNHLNGVLEVPLGGQPVTDPVAAYDPVGWPTFAYWPQPRTLTHEQFYWRWLERAHAGGLRLMTNLLVDNTALCQAFPVKKNSCNEMDGVRLQAKRLFELQDYIDAQSGGPGEGWLRIVTSPAQAREVINAGRLAVVLGIEVSVLFDCGEILDQPQCMSNQIDERLQEVFDMGVRQMELINKFDNALSGVTGDSGETGLVVNQGNRSTTGHYWDMRTCEEEEGHSHEPEGHEHDKTQVAPTDATPGDGEGIDALAGRVLNEFGGATRGFVAPLYAPGPHCNARGLTGLGEHLIRAMLDKGMIFDPDHMSALAQREALDLIEDVIIPDRREEAADGGRPFVQPAVVSSHSWANDVVYQRIYALDGVVAPRTEDAGGFVASWKKHRDFAAANAPAGSDIGTDFGLGYGADTNGLGGQPGPRSDPAVPLTYTEDGFAAPIGGVRLTQQVSGIRTFDINTEGVSHYGLFADWFAELALAADELAPDRGGGEAIIDDMLNGSETYLQLWERAVYGTNDCVTDGSTLQVEDLHAALGLNLDGFLTAVGQPADRTDGAYVYCVAGDDGPTVVEVAFDDAGVAADVRPATPGCSTSRCRLP